MPKVDLIHRWIFQSGQVVGLQLIVQALFAINGLLLLWNLSKEEYAWFTIASSLLATMVLLGDGGVSAGLTSVGGRIHQQAGAFANLLSDAIKRSRIIFFVSLAVTLPVYYSLYGNANAPSSIVHWALVLMALAGLPSVGTTLLGVANRLHARANIIQAVEIVGGIVRLTITGLLLATRNFNLLTCLGAIALSSWIQYFCILNQSKFFFTATHSNESHAKELNGFIRALFGNHIFFCVQGQISLWLISWFGTASDLADLSAIGRLVALFTIIFSPVNYLVLPSIAKIRDQKLLRKRVMFTFIALISLIFSIVLIACWIPNSLLWILGEKYRHLEAELPLSIAAQGTAVTSGFVWSLILVRGWVKRVWITMLTATAGIAIAASLFPLGTVAGMLKFSIVSIIPTFIFCSAILIYRLRDKNQATESL